MVATSGPQTMKFAEPRSVLRWIVLATSIIVSIRVSYHSRTVPVKAGPIESDDARVTGVPVVLLTKRPGARDQ